jgi:voltage-gated potassium channel
MVVAEGRRERVVSPVDWVMLALAVFSIGLLGYVTFFRHSAETAHTVFVVDTSICGVFLLEFLWRWRRDRWAKSFVLRNWFEILGMIPIAHPALRGFRLLRIVVLLLRLARATDRALGERFTQRLVERLSRPIVVAIKKPITVAVMDEVVKVLETGNYPENLSRSLSANRQQLQEIITEKLREDPQAGRFKRFPFHDEIVQSVIDTAMRITLAVLADPRIDEFFADVVRDNREQIRQAILLGLNERRNDDADEERREELMKQLPTRPQGALAHFPKAAQDSEM